MITNCMMEFGVSFQRSHISLSVKYFCGVNTLSSLICWSFNFSRPPVILYSELSNEQNLYSSQISIVHQKKKEFKWFLNRVFLLFIVNYPILVLVFLLWNSSTFVSYSITLLFLLVRVLFLFPTANLRFPSFIFTYIYFDSFFFFLKWHR